MCLIASMIPFCREFSALSELMTKVIIRSQKLAQIFQIVEPTDITINKNFITFHEKEL
jgi:hypothetical protein